VVIRSESERRRAEEQVAYLQSELEKIPVSEQVDEVTASVINGLRMQISDINEQLAEYDRLKKGLEPVLTAESFDDIGELVIKARIARGWSQADLARTLGMEPQQVQRYERYDWEKISLWRLQEVVEALNLRWHIQANLMESPGTLWTGVTYSTPVKAVTDVDVAHSLSRYTLSGRPTTTIQEDESASVDELEVKPSVQKPKELDFAHLASSA
jgi:transcriptional regulator with XRE-family HTH domain